LALNIHSVVDVGRWFQEFPWKGQDGPSDLVPDL